MTTDLVADDLSTDDLSADDLSADDLLTEHMIADDPILDEPATFDDACRGLEIPPDIRLEFFEHTDQFRRNFRFKNGASGVNLVDWRHPWTLRRLKSMAKHYAKGRNGKEWWRLTGNDKTSACGEYFRWRRL